MSDNERLIGKVIAVESDRVLIELEKDSKSLTKTFISGTYPIARINSYLVIPIGSVSIIAVVTKVSMANEHIELTHESTISLPQPKRTLVASMVGTIEKDSESKYVFNFGISQFPVLNNPVWFILDEELDGIFDKEKNDKYFIEIGKSTTYNDYSIKINPDKLFSRHLSVLGNTGAGKSNTIASILQAILKNEDVTKGKGAHFIIFDTNGEYKNAFCGHKEFDTLYVNQSTLRIPYWFLNFSDLTNLFQAKEGTQIPILQQAILDAKNKIKILDSSITGLSEFIADRQKFFQSQKLKNNAEWALTKINEEVEKKFDIYFGQFVESADEELITDEVDRLKELAKKHPAQQFLKEIKQFRNDQLDAFKKEFTAEVKKVITTDEKNERPVPRYDVDSPHFFSIKDFKDKYLEQALNEAGGSIRDKCSYLLLRINKFIYDSRYAFIFKCLKETEGYDYALAHFLRICFGKTKNINKKESKITDSDYFLNKIKGDISDFEKNYQVIIFDLSLTPYDILQNVTALLGRLILEFLQRIEKNDDYKGRESRGSFPTVLVLEEAHNYIPQPKSHDESNVSREIFERIAREGRKYGLSLVISSQRPSELSRTVLSQCNSYIVHRIQNPEDQDYIRKLLPSISHDLLKQLPVLAQGIALIFGDCVRAPMQVKINLPNPGPKSSDPEYWKHWTNSYDTGEFSLEDGEPDFEKISEKWENS